MVAFVLLAAALTVGGVMLVAIPLLRRAAPPAATAPAPWAAMAAAALLVLGSAVLYVSWSKWSWRDAPAADTPQSMVARLARELEHNPQNLDGWMMLGRSYVTLQEYPLALRAFERADRLSDGKNAEALTGEAEALALTDESELTGRAGRLIERALAISPDSGKALFFGAAVAERRGDLALARARFAKLLSLNPPADVRPIIEQQITYARCAPGRCCVTRSRAAPREPDCERREQRHGGGARECVPGPLTRGRGGLRAAVRVRTRPRSAGAAPGRQTAREPFSAVRVTQFIGRDDARQGFQGRPERPGGGAYRAQRQSGRRERRSVGPGELSSWPGRPREPGHRSPHAVVNSRNQRLALTAVTYKYALQIH